MKKRLLTGILTSAGVMVLILDSVTASLAAQEALQLCIRVVIPSLFPFFVLINLLSGTMYGLKIKWLAPFERLLKIPSGSISLLLCGLLGGYPTGAQMIHGAWKSGAVDRQNAQRMLGFCSNAGPAFLFGIIGPMFSDGSTVWILWLIHILSSVFVACITKETTDSAPLLLKQVPASLTQALRQSVTVMAYVCGWIVLFRVLISFLNRWFLWCLPIELEVAITSLLELANGCTLLKQIENEGLRMIVASASVSFGGICVLMQTSSVTTGLKISSYIKGKVVQTAFAVILTVVAQSILLAEHNRIHLDLIEVIFALLIFALLLYLPQMRKITVDFRKKLLYNERRNK